VDVDSCCSVRIERLGLSGCVDETVATTSSGYFVSQFYFRHDDTNTSVLPDGLESSS
jgi:hypothetical protein